MGITLSALRVLFKPIRRLYYSHGLCPFKRQHFLCILFCQLSKLYLLKKFCLEQEHKNTKGMDA
jgi:hypothetical protein